MMQIKGKKSENTERYKKALGLAPGSTPLSQTLGMMPSERARLEREREARMAKGPAPTIRGKTDSSTQDDPEERPQSEDDQSDNSDLDEFHDDDAELMQRLREKRLKELKKEQEISQKFKQAGQGSYGEIKESEFIDTLKKSMVSIVHFYHRDFELCKIMDKHLEIIAKRHMETKIVRMDAEKAPFFVDKLRIQTLPTVCCFIDAVLKEKLIGFDELGGHDGFKTKTLERWLEDKDMLKVTEEEREDRRAAKEAREERLRNPIRVGGLDDDLLF